MGLGWIALALESFVTVPGAAGQGDKSGRKLQPALQLVHRGLNVRAILVRVPLNWITACSKIAPMIFSELLQFEQSLTARPANRGGLRLPSR